jgi:hypothetical protein
MTMASTLSDPGPRGTAMNDAEKNHYFLWVEITLKEGKLPAFKRCTLKLIPEVAKVGWNLVAACSAVTGVPDTVYHLWQIPEGNSLLDVMVQFSDTDVYQELLDCCERQVQQLLTSMPYNPLGANPQPKQSRRLAGSRSLGKGGGTKSKSARR